MVGHLQIFPIVTRGNIRVVARISLLVFQLRSDQLAKTPFVVIAEKRAWAGLYHPRTLVVQHLARLLGCLRRFQLLAIIDKAKSKVFHAKLFWHVVVSKRQLR